MLLPSRRQGCERIFAADLAGRGNTALGIGAGASGREIEALLRQAGCKTDFLFLKEGASRVNLKIRTPEGEETDLNGAGPEISEEALERLGESFSPFSPGTGWCWRAVFRRLFPQAATCGF